MRRTTAGFADLNSCNDLPRSQVLQSIPLSADCIPVSVVLVYGPRGPESLELDAVDVDSSSALDSSGVSSRWSGFGCRLAVGSP